MAFVTHRFLREGRQLPAELEEARKEIEALAQGYDNALVLPCDVTKGEDIDAVFATIKQEFGHLDSLIHGAAFAKREELKGDFYHTTKEGYMLAHEVSAYSLTAVSRRAIPLMEGRQGSIVTLTYIGSERVVRNYNVMGIAKAALEASVRYLANDVGPMGHRVNAISAGPIRTLSASGVEGFTKILDHIAAHSPLRRNITADEVLYIFDVENLADGPAFEVRAASGKSLSLGMHVHGCWMPAGS